jgi:hypothetical protein
MKVAEVVGAAFGKGNMRSMCSDVCLADCYSFGIGGDRPTAKPNHQGPKTLKLNSATKTKMD